MIDRGADQLFADVVASSRVDNIESAIERAVEQLFDGARGNILIADFGSAEA